LLTRSFRTQALKTFWSPSASRLPPTTMMLSRSRWIWGKCATRQTTSSIRLRVPSREMSILLSATLCSTTWKEMRLPRPQRLCKSTLIGFSASLRRQLPKSKPTEKPSRLPPKTRQRPRILRHTPKRRHPRPALPNKRPQHLHRRARRRTRRMW